MRLSYQAAQNVFNAWHGFAVVYDTCYGATAEAGRVLRQALCTRGVGVVVTNICGGVLRQELVEYRAKYFTGPGLAPPPILALGLSSRKNLCVHPAVAGAATAGLSMVA